MSDWPLDGIIGFSVIIAAIFCLAFSSLFDRGKTGDAQLLDGYYRMAPMPSAKVLALGIFLMAGVMLYAVSQSGLCAGMTETENRLNQIAGYVLALVFLCGGIYGVYLLLIPEYRFNRDTFVYESPFSKAAFPWRSLTETGFKWQSRYIRFSGGKNIYLPYNLHRAGLAQLQVLIDMKLNSFDAPPFLPLADPETLRSLTGKTVSGAFILVTDDLHTEFVHHFSGVFDGSDDRKIYIRSAAGKRLAFPLNLRGIWPNEMKEGPEEEGEPDFEAYWYVQAGFDIGSLKRDYL